MPLGYSLPRCKTDILRKQPVYSREEGRGRNLKGEETTMTEKRNITKEDVLLKTRLIAEGVHFDFKGPSQRGNN